MITAALVIFLVLLKDEIAKLFFLLEAGLAKILDLLYETFMIFAGVTPVLENGNQTYLLDYFFHNDLIGTLYWGMALIGIAMTFGFGIWSLVKKLFDYSGEKVKATNGQILLNMCKAILIILLLTAIVSATITATGTLMQQVDYLFNAAYELNDPSEIYFDDEDYATMFRIIDTIDNYAINPSYNNRININNCYNSIRNDLNVLARNGIFKFTYDIDAEAKASWQYALRQLYTVADVNEDLPLDIYNSGVTNAINNIVEKLRTDASFIPLSYYYRGYNNLSENNESVLGRTVMLSGSFSAAKTKKYNDHPDIMDDLRRPFYKGEKSIFDISEADDYFSTDFGDWNHLVVILLDLILLLELFKILINCVARIFNIILLYVTAPTFVAVMPLDDGGKFKQWCTAFVIQSLSIFGTFFAVRLLMVFVPVILSGDLVIFSVSWENLLAKMVIIVGICFTAQKAGGLISGILADNAGYQSLMAGDVGSGVASKAMSVGTGLLKVGAKVGGAALKELGTELGVSHLAKKAGDKATHAKQAMTDNFGVFGAFKNGWKTDEDRAKDKKDKEDQVKEEKDTQFRNSVTGSLSAIAKRLSPPPEENPVEKKDNNSNGDNKNPIEGINHNEPVRDPQNGVIQQGSNSVDSNNSNGEVSEPVVQGNNGTSVSNNKVNEANLNQPVDRNTNTEKVSEGKVQPKQQPKQKPNEQVPPPIQPFMTKTDKDKDKK